MVDPSGPVQGNLGPVVDFDLVETCLADITRAVRGGAEGCRHALQVLRALKHYLNQRASTGIDPAERLVLRQLVARARGGLRMEEVGVGVGVGEELFRAVLVDLEQMTVCDGRGEAVDHDHDVDGDGAGKGNGMCEREVDAAGDGPIAMVTEASSATVACAACGSVILERRMEAHVRFWCSET
jgi:hypothetical protein